jgi:hypothetical protein
MCLQVFTKAFLLQGKRWRRCRKCINSELGFRFRKNAFSVNWVLYNDFLIYKGTDNMSGGGTGTGDLFNAGCSNC